MNVGEQWNKLRQNEKSSSTENCWVVFHRQRNTPKKKEVKIPKVTQAIEMEIKLMLLITIKINIFIIILRFGLF